MHVPSTLSSISCLAICRILLSANLLFRPKALGFSFVECRRKRNGRGPYSLHVASSSSRQGIVQQTLPQTHPLPPHTFAGQVEQRLVERFGGGDNDIDRVLTSWRLLEAGYVHNEYFGSSPDRKEDVDDMFDTSKCQSLQHCHSYLPGLTVQEFWEVPTFDWCAKLQDKYPQILQEFQTVTADLESLKEQGNNIWAGALTEDASSYGEGWKTLVLMDRGRWDPVNVNLFPVTAKAVKDSGVPATEVFFASMQPHTVIKPHSDFTNFVLTSHLPLVVPYSGQNKCRLTIGETTREWINGQLLLFDTSIIHDAVNDSDQTRYILMLRLWHPDLTAIERAALQFTFDCLEFPDLLSPDPEERFRAELLAEQMRAFPEIKKGIRKVAGFGGGGEKKGGAKKKRNGR